MFKSPRDHFVQNVHRTYSDFFEMRRRNEFGVNNLVRHAVNAATALYHMREHLDPSPGYIDLVALCPDYALVRDVANASKHGEITQHHPQITTADQIAEVARCTIYRDEQGEYPNAQVEVVVRLNDGTERNLADALHNVMSMWCSKLDDLGIITTTNAEPPLTDRHVPRVEAASRQLPMELMQGEAWSSTLQLRRFDYQKGVPVPIDLTGSKVEMRIYKPIEKVPMSLSLGPNGPTIDFDVPLTPEQGLTFLRLETDEARGKYVAGLVESNPPLQRDLSQRLSALVASGQAALAKP